MGEAPGEDSRFESAMRHSAIGMSLVAPDGTFLEVNAALCTMLGRGEAELRATTWQELTHPDDLAADASLVQEVVDGLRDSYRLAKRYLRPDGTVVHGDLLVVGMRGDDGAFEYLIAQVVDMTEQVRLTDRYRMLAENATDVVALADNDGVVQWISDAVTRVVGWAPSDMEGRPWADFIHADDQPLMRENQVRLRAGEWVEMELRVRASDGTHRWASFRVRPIADEAGTVVGRVAAWWDSEDTHEAREALRRSEEKLRASLDAQADSHIFMDAVRDDAGEIVDFVLVDANQATFDFFGRERTAMIGSSMMAGMPTDRANQLLAIYGHTVDTGEPLVIDGWRAYSADGRDERYFDLRGVKLGDGLSLSAREVTDRVRSAEALAASERQAHELARRYEQVRDEALEANAAKTGFLSRMSHELRTPLNAILGFAQLLELEQLTDDQREFVTQIRTGGRHLLGLVSEVLDVSRIESGTLTLSLEPVSVADAVDEALDLVRNQATAAGVSVRRADRAHRAHDAHVLADRQRLVQVLVNLLSNGVKYNHEGGSVELSCEQPEPDLVAIRVTDTGRGLHPDHLDRLFEPFDRLGAEQSTIEGTGIGLTLSRGLAHAMSGRIEVESVLGEGSVFSLVLPRTQPVADDLAPAEVVARPVAGHDVDVLYVEDNPANQALMTRIARLRPGATLRLASTGAAGTAAARERTPDLVLLDLHLPDIQGDEVLGRLRAAARTRRGAHRRGHGRRHPGGRRPASRSRRGWRHHQARSTSTTCSPGSTGRPALRP